MNKSDLINAVVKEVSLTKVQAGKALDALLTSIEGALGKGEKVTLVGFGTFTVARRKARTGRNPSTGAELKIPAKQVPKFMAGVKLREAASGMKGEKPKEKSKQKPKGKAKKGKG